MATPYITPSMLLARPAGISWNVVPTLTADTAAQQAQLAQVCWNATSTVDTYCRQPLRATVNTEILTGPGQRRVALDPDTGVTTLVTPFRHVTQALAVQTSLTRYFPAVWSPVAAANYRLRHPVFTNTGALSTGPIGGNVVDLAPYTIDWRHGRGGWQIQVSYVSGWPHASLTAPAAAGATTVSVDDVTGWAQGWTGFCYDGIATETVTAQGAAATTSLTLPNNAGTAQSGPGTVTLAAPLTQPHPVGAVFSAMTPAVLRAAALAATVEALETIDAIATQSLSGQMAGGTTVLAEEVEMILDPYMRVG